MSTKNLLIVEDNSALGRVMSRFTTQAGYKTYCAETAHKALEILASEQIHLMTLDIRLPDMDANQFLEVLSKKGITTPVVVISATLEHLIHRPSQVKATLAKPFSGVALIETLQSVTT